LFTGNFKELRVWQESVNLSANIYHFTSKEPFSKDYGLCNEIQRSAVSVASNIAKGSAAEVITQLDIAHKIGYIDENILLKLENQTEKIRASLKKSINSRGGNNYYNKLKWLILGIFIPI